MAKKFTKNFLTPYLFLSRNLLDPFLDSLFLLIMLSGGKKLVKYKTRNKHATELNYENTFLLGGENKIKEPHIYLWVGRIAGIEPASLVPQTCALPLCYIRQWSE